MKITAIKPIMADGGHRIFVFVCVSLLSNMTQKFGNCSISC